MSLQAASSPANSSLSTLLQTLEYRQTDIFRPHSTITEAQWFMLMLFEKRLRN